LFALLACKQILITAERTLNADSNIINTSFIIYFLCSLNASSYPASESDAAEMVSSMIALHNMAVL